MSERIEFGRANETEPTGRGAGPTSRRGQNQLGWKQAKRLALEELAGVQPAGMGWTPARIGRALGLSVGGRLSATSRKAAWKRAIARWAQEAAKGAITSGVTTLPQGEITADAFDLSNPYDQYLRSLIAPRGEIEAAEGCGPAFVGTGASNAGSEVGAMQKIEAPINGMERRKVSHIAGRAMTGEHYVPLDCPDCKTKLPWAPQCPACTAAFESRLAIARAEAGVVGATQESWTESDGQNGRLCNSNSFAEFMARQLHLPLIEPVE